MTLKTRRIMLSVCVILFIVLSPLITLYSFGFRYDFKNKQVIQTGIIYLTPTPQDGIKILVNGKEEKQKLSVKGLFKKEYALYNLLPQTYSIKIGKAGYSEWKKNLTVSPGQITYAHPLLLPLDSPNETIADDTNILDWSLSPDSGKVAYIKKENEKLLVILQDIAKKNTKFIALNNLAGNLPAMPDFSGLEPSSVKILWTADSGAIALMINGSFSLVVLLGANQADISYLASASGAFAAIYGKWNSRDDSFIYLTSENKLYSLNSASGKSDKIADSISAFTLKNGDIYSLDANKSAIYKFTPENPGDKRQISFGPLKLSAGGEPAENPNTASPAGQIIISAQNNIAVITPEKNLFLIRQNGVPAFVDSNVESAKFSQNNETLLYNSSFEIFAYSPGDGAKNLITRMAQEVKNVEWYADYEHIWFTAGNSLKNIELDSRPVPNIIDLQYIPAPSMNFIYSDLSGDIYYDQLEGNKLTIYRLKIGG